MSSWCILSQGTLYEQDAQDNVYKPVGAKSSFQIGVKNNTRNAADPAFNLVVNKKDETIINEDVSSTGNVTYDMKTASVMWPTFSARGSTVRYWAFRFTGDGSSSAASSAACAKMTEQFVDVFNQCVYCVYTGGEAVDPFSIGADIDDDGNNTAGGGGGGDDDDDDEPAVSAKQSSAASKASRASAASKKKQESKKDDKSLKYYLDGARVEQHVEEDSAAAAPAAASSSGSSRYLRLGGGEYRPASLNRNDGINKCLANSTVHSRIVVLRTPSSAQRGGGSGGAHAEPATVFQAHRYDPHTHHFAPEAPAEFKIEDVSVTNPRHTLLRKNDTNILVLGEKQLDVMSAVDVERAEVVQKYQTPDERNFVSMTAMHKGDLDAPLVSCLSRNVAFVMDTRLDPTKSVVLEEGKELADYSLRLPQSGRENFTCSATSAKGHLAVGDMVGQVRLFSGPPGARRPEGGRYPHHPKTCKTLLDAAPATPIRALDITADGAYVLATCDKFLLLMNTVYDNNSNEEGGEKVLNGFLSRMGDNKPHPLRLQLTPEQILAVGGPRNVKFSKAVFESESSTSGETAIVAAVGKHLAAWSMASVKQMLAQENRMSVDGTLQAEGSGGEITHVCASAHPEAGAKVTFMSEQELGIEDVVAVPEDNSESGDGGSGGGRRPRRNKVRIAW